MEHLKSRPVYEAGVAESLGIVSVTRKEALIRVLDTTIWLWVLEKDPLPIHLLVMSQYRKLQEIGEKKGVTPYTALVTNPAQRSLVYDFLRHNTAAGVDFTPALLNPGYLFDTICTFEVLFGGTTDYMKAFLAYFALWFPQNFPQFGDIPCHELPKGWTAENARADFLSLSRTAFFAKLTKAFREDAVGGGVHIESP